MLSLLLDRLEKFLRPGDWLDWPGTLTVESAVADFEQAVAISHDAGALIEVLSAEGSRELEPLLLLTEGERVAFELRSVWVDAPAMIEQLVRVFTLSGGELLIGSGVAAIERDVSGVSGALPWLNGFYFIVTHGGVGWGPVWADLAAQEILDGSLLD